MCWKRRTLIQQLDYSNHNPCGIRPVQLCEQTVEAYVDFGVRHCSLLWGKAFVGRLLCWSIRDR